MPTHNMRGEIGKISYLEEWHLHVRMEEFRWSSWGFIYRSAQDFHFSYMIPVSSYSFYEERFGNRQAL